MRCYFGLSIAKINTLASRDTDGISGNEKLASHCMTRLHTSFESSSEKGGYPNRHSNMITPILQMSTLWSYTKSVKTSGAI